jgi:predicted dehydrogenase
MDHKVLPVQRDDPLALQIDHFAEVALGKARPLVTGQDGLAALKIIQAIKQAAATGILIAID